MDGLTCEIELPLPKDRPGLGGYSGQARGGGMVAARPPQESERGKLEGKRILVIEDEPLVAMDLESSLMAAGCEVVGPAGTIEEAKSLVADGRYDAALVDVNLAGHPVDEIAAALTQKNCPFAFVTGYGREALPRGFRDAIVLGKPFGQEQLVGAVELLLYREKDVVPLRQKSLSRRSLR
jgi:DNA-binding response OmpR family regulator